MEEMMKHLNALIAAILAGLNCLFPVINNQHFMKTRPDAKS